MYIQIYSCPLETDAPNYTTYTPRADLLTRQQSNVQYLTRSIGLTLCLRTRHTARVLQNTGHHRNNANRRIELLNQSRRRKIKPSQEAHAGGTCNRLLRPEQQVELAT